MNRNNLLSLIALDIVVLVLAAGFIFFRYHSLTSMPDPLPMMTRRASPPPPAPAKEPSPLKTAAEPPAPKKDAAPAALPAKTTRNIGFMYRNSKAVKVEIIGDFNKWVPQPLAKGADHRWTISIVLNPGEYAYNYVVDGKPIRDPNNPRMCDVGRGFPNSYLNVKPLTHENEKNK